MNFVKLYIDYISGGSGINSNNDSPVDAKKLSEGEVNLNTGADNDTHTESHLKAEMWWQVLNNGKQGDRGNQAGNETFLTNLQPD